MGRDDVSGRVPTNINPDETRSVRTLVPPMPIHKRGWPFMPFFSTPQVKCLYLALKNYVTIKVFIQCNAGWLLLPHTSPHVQGVTNT